MSKDDVAVVGVLLLFLVFGFVFGFVFGSWAGKFKADQLHWMELVKRGYAVEIESSAGKGYKWKE